MSKRRNRKKQKIIRSTKRRIRNGTELAGGVSSYISPAADERTNVR